MNTDSVGIPALYVRIILRRVFDGVYFFVIGLIFQMEV